MKASQFEIGSIEFSHRVQVKGHVLDSQLLSGDEERI